MPLACWFRRCADTGFCLRQPAKNTGSTKFAIARTRSPARQRRVLPRALAPRGNCQRCTSMGSRFFAALIPKHYKKIMLKAWQSPTDSIRICAVSDQHLRNNSMKKTTPQQSAFSTFASSRLFVVFARPSSGAARDQRPIRHQISSPRHQVIPAAALSRLAPLITTMFLHRYATCLPGTRPT